MNRPLKMVLLGIAISAPQLIRADVPSVEYQDLATVALAEMASFQLEPEAKAKQLAAHCVLTMQGLEQHINTLGELERDQWLRHLRWSELQDQLQHAPRNPQRLLQLSKAFYAVRTGLEAPVVLQVRSSLENYVAFLLAVDGRTEHELKREVARRLQSVAEILKTDALNHQSLREHEAWLSIIGQSPRTVDGLRRAFDQPNLVVRVSRAMVPNLLQGLQEPVQQSNWAVNWILGRRVEGMTHFEGKIQPETPQVAPEALFDLHLSGKVSAPKNTTHAGPWRVYSQSETKVQATKRILWDGMRLAAEPASAVAQPYTQLTGAGIRRQHLLGPNRLGHRIDRVLAEFALIRARRLQAEARREVARKTEQGIAQQFDEAVSDRLQEVNRNVAYYYTDPLVRVGMLPDSRGIVNQDHLAMLFHVHGLSQLAAAGPPEKMPKGDIDVSIHESVLPNLIHRYAGGRAWTDEFFARIQKEAVGDYSVELRIQEEAERWSLTLDWLCPWSTRITPSGVCFTVNASDFSVEGQAYPSRLVIQSTFVPLGEVGPGYGWERVGQVRIHSSDPLPTPLHDFLHRKLSSFFSESFFLDGLNAPAGGPWDTLSTVVLSDLVLADGWLHLSFNQTRESL